MTISVVIVGRNSLNQLCRSYSSECNSLGFADEVIYVDSASTDGSVDYAISLGWRVFRMETSGILSAAAGRNVGANEARGEFILFLDSDMLFESTEPFQRIRDAMIEQLDDGTCGWTGDVIDCYPTGRARRRRQGWRNGQQVPFFGGFVLLRRSDLLRAGNWNPCVIANEEIELYARLQAIGSLVRYSTRFYCYHYTIDQSAWATLRAAYLPLSPRERRYFGSYGFAFRASCKAGTLIRLISIAPEPILMALGTLLCVLKFFSLGGIAFLSLFITVLRRRSIKYLAVCPARVVHLCVGIIMFRESIPIYHEVSRDDLRPVLSGLGSLPDSVYKKSNEPI